MAVSVASSGIQSGTVGTEYVLSSGTAGTFQFIVDADNLQNGDLLYLRIKVETFSGQPTKQLWQTVVANDLGGEPLLISPPFPAPIRYVATLQQASGTSRAFPWAIYTY